MQLLKLEDS